MTAQPVVITALADVEAEQAVLGAVLLDNAQLASVQVHLAPGDFSLERHRLLAEGMWALGGRGEPLDVVTMRNELERRGTLAKCGGVGAIAELSIAAPSATSAEHYAGIVAEASWRRRMRDGLTLALADIEAGSPREDIEAAIDRARMTGAGRRRGLRRVRELMAEARERLTAVATRGGIVGLATGLSRLDVVLGGLRPGKLYILAARPGLGKSSMAVQFALHVAGQAGGYRVAIFSAEMPEEEVADRMIACAAGIDGTTLLTRGLDDPVRWATEHLSNFAVWVDDTPRITMSAIRTECRYLVAQGGLDLVVIDYAQLLRPDERVGTKTEQMSELGAACKALAKELRIPVVLISQLNRECEREQRRPRLTDLRDGGLEQDADVVVFVWRDKEVRPRLDGRVDVELIVDKHRGGRRGKVPAVFDGKTFTFGEATGNS